MPLKTHRDEQPSLNLTPMIDIVFLLIIFFMVGTKFTELERSMALKVPAVSDVSTLTAAPKRRVINVYRDGSLSLDGELISRGELADRLKSSQEEYPGLGVVVRGDADGTFQSVADVLSTCRQAGIAEMGISVRLARREP